MSVSHLSWLAVRPARAIASFALVVLPALAAAQQATVSGRVAAKGTSEPLPEARVFLVGTTLNVATGPDGRYTLRGVPTGAAEVRVIRVGYQEQKKAVTVAAGATVTLDFVMKQAIVQLQEIVTTATGQQRRVEIGNTIATLGDGGDGRDLAGDEHRRSARRKAPGVVVLPGAMTGTAPKIRIRGVELTLIEQCADLGRRGVRFNAGSFGAAGAGGTMVNGDEPPRHQSRRHRRHRDREGTVGRDALWHGCVERRHRRDDEKGSGGERALDGFGEGGAIKDEAHYPDT